MLHTPIKHALGEKALAASKRVRFSSGTTDNIPTFTPLRKPHPSAVRKKWIAACEAEDYQGLTEYLTAKQISVRDLFSKEGYSLLNWAVSDIGAASLKFIYEIVPRDTLQQILGQKDFGVINTFFEIEGGKEICHVDNNHGDLKISKEKLDLLLKMDAEKVNAYVTKAIESGWLSEKILNNFKEVFEHHKINAIKQSI